MADSVRLTNEVLVSFTTSEKPIDWQGLLDEFESFEPDEEACRFEADLFDQSLIDPPAEFVKAFVEKKLMKNNRPGEALRSLYFFLLKKRYEERLNLLHFAFKIFDDDTRLPAEIINLTPFPHEDGIPKFKHIGDSSYQLAPPTNQ